MTSMPIQTSAPETSEAERHMPDLQALDEALREVIVAARDQKTQATPEQLDDVAQDGDLSDTMDVVMRAAKTIDHLIERNRAVTDAAVRSVEFLRQETAQARAEADQLRAEMEALRAETDALKSAALAHAEELEAELAFKDQELKAAHSWIENIRGQVESLLGNVETRLDEAAPEHLFSRD